MVQQVTKSGTTSDSKWQRVTQRVIQQVTTNGNEWEQMTAVVQRMKTAQYTSKNRWLTDTLLPQGMDGFNYSGLINRLSLRSSEKVIKK